MATDDDDALWMNGPTEPIHTSNIQGRPDQARGRDPPADRRCGPRVAAPAGGHAPGGGAGGGVAGIYNKNKADRLRKGGWQPDLPSVGVRVCTHTHTHNHHRHPPCTDRHDRSAGRSGSAGPCPSSSTGPGACVSRSPARPPYGFHHHYHHHTCMYVYRQTTHPNLTNPSKQNPKNAATASPSPRCGAGRPTSRA